MYTLYYSPGAASLVVHWLLLEIGAPHELRLTSIDEQAHKRPDYLALNPNGVIPTLIVDGQPLYEAAALAMYLADRHPEAGLAPAAGDPQRGAYYQWMLNLTNTLQSPLRVWWYPQDLAVDADTIRRGAAARIEATCARIDAHLAAHGPFLLGETPCAADFYLTMLMRWSRKLAHPADSWPHLGALAASLKARPAFKTLYEREGLTEWA